MKRTKTNEGITLIALIITIVVLLILAVVAVSSIQSDGILRYAGSAADSYNKAAQNEVGIIEGYLGYLSPCGTDGHTYGEWSIATQANCGAGEEGTKERTCSACGHKETVTYLHVWESESYIATCTACGEVCEHRGYGYNTERDDYSMNDDYWCYFFTEYCNNCNTVRLEDYAGHVYDTGVCSTCNHACSHDEALVMGYETCNNCQKVLLRVINLLMVFVKIVVTLVDIGTGVQLQQFLLALRDIK